MVLESGLLHEREDHYELTGPLPPLAIPATLHDSLMARLDRLAAGKAVAQLGATLGRAFPYALLAAVSPLDEETLQQALARLVEAELLYQRGVPPQATYLFKHALIQEAAYQSLLKSTRQQYHQRIAQVLEEQFPETAETQPELLAYHYTEAGLTEQAIPYWQQAGQRALERSAYVEAISHLTKGLEVLKTLPDTPERTRQELTLQMILAPPLMAAKGLAAPEVERAYTRALVLCRQVGETPQLFSVLVGLWRFHAVRAEYQTAHELEERLLRLAQSVQDPALLLEAHRPPGQTLFCLGELVQARAHLEQALALYNPAQHRSHAVLYGNDAGVMCLSWLSWTLWVLGYPDRALERSHEALTLAQELAHPPSLAAGLHFAFMFHQLRREGPATQERAEALMTLSTEQGLSVFFSVLIGNDPAGLGAGQAGTASGGAGADTSKPGCPSSLRGGDAPTAFSCPAG
jgi:predicted ATPase